MREYEKQSIREKDRNVPIRIESSKREYERKPNKDPNLIEINRHSKRSK
jgi:hypothetical protein